MLFGFVVCVHLIVDVANMKRAVLCVLLLPTCNVRD